MFVAKPGRPWMPVALMPMTHAPETGAIRMESIYGAGFWSVCHGPYALQPAQPIATPLQLILKVNPVDYAVCGVLQH